MSNIDQPANNSYKTELWVLDPTYLDPNQEPRRPTHLERNVQNLFVSNADRLERSVSDTDPTMHVETLKAERITSSANRLVIIDRVISDEYTLEEIVIRGITGFNRKPGNFWSNAEGRVFRRYSQDFQHEPYPFFRLPLLNYAVRNLTTGYMTTANE